jgi:hypothetical protein
VRERFLDMCAPLTLFLTLAGWLLAQAAAFGVMAWGWYGVPISTLPVPRRGSAPLVLVGGVLTALLLCVWAVHLGRFCAAFSRRERLVARLVDQAVEPPDAEAVLADYLRTGSRDGLNGMFAEWAGWFADLRCTHVAYPALIFARPASVLCWIRAAMIVLDAAALTQAAAPGWAPPHTRPLVAGGIRCLQHLTARVGVALPRVAVSLQGREECGFTDTLLLALGAGLPAERDERQTWSAFQDLRIRYAPHATALAAHLLYPHSPRPTRRIDVPDLESTTATG